MKTIDFKTLPYFSGTMTFLGVMLLLSGLWMMFVNILVGLVLVLLSVIIFTTHYRVSIDLGNKSFHDYLWILGISEVKGDSLITLSTCSSKRTK
ncbi:MAG: hypothetical protein AB7O48_14590 [Cyclobacteriaceae bacterium]